MNGTDIAQQQQQQRPGIAQTYFYEQQQQQQRRDDDPQQVVPQQPPPPPSQQQQQQQQQSQPPPPPFAAGYDAHQSDQPQNNGDNSAEDSDDQLSVQTLNADGTPKRPMNAFLLYAKKRRPQISTNHPTMRTGEISKVLSKEWQTMPKTEKQYYQDKAKKLKDSFNLRWPDYVYKRRPNNSRKKRRGIPNTDSPVVEDTSRRDSEGADNDAYGDNSGGDDAEGSPNLVVRLPHDRDDAQHRMGMPYGSGPPAPGDPRANPPPPNGAPMGSRMPYPPNGPQGGYGYDDQYGQYPYYPNNGSSQPPNRLPPVWSQHDASRSPYEGPRSASTGYSPVGEGDQQWPGGRPGGNPSPITPSWQNPMHGQPAGPMSARPAPRSSADNSPVQASGDLAFRANGRPPPTPQSAGPRPFQTLNAPMYPPAPGGPHGQRGGSPPPYGAGYGYGAPGAPQAPGTANGVGRSPVLPAISSLDHSSYGAHQQPSSNMRGDAGYSPMLPPLGGPTDSRPPQNAPYPSPREVPGGVPGDADRSRALPGATPRQASGDLDRASRGDGRDHSAAAGMPGLGGSHHQTYWDPVKAEAGE